MTAAGPVVLLAAHDLFESGYVEAVLVARGIVVVGPFLETEQALRAAETPGLTAAVIAAAPEPSAPEPSARARLADELGRRGIPYLTLARGAAAGAAAERPVLTRPYAGYQVADWVAQVQAGEQARPAAAADVTDRST